MSKRFLTSVLIQLSFLILTIAIVDGVASAQENRNFASFVPSSLTEINRNHYSVGELNLGLNSNIILLGGNYNQQDINRTHIPIGELNRDQDRKQAEADSSFRPPQVYTAFYRNPTEREIDQKAFPLIMKEADAPTLSIDDVYKKSVPRGTLDGVEDSINIDAYKEEIRIHPYSAETHFRLGLAYNEIGHKDEAIEAYKQAIMLEPDFAEAHFVLGLAYMELGRYNDAIGDFNQVIRILPEEPIAHFVLGLAYAEQNTYEAAIEALKQTIRINPDFAEAHFVLGLVYINLGDKTSALDEYKILKSKNRDLADRLFSQIYR